MAGVTGIFERISFLLQKSLFVFHGHRFSFCGIYITDCDYTTLPNFLAGTVKHLKMSLECKEDIGFKSASIYKYKVGMDKAQLILDVDMSEITDTISYEEDNPLMNSTYILYYEVAR